MLIALALINKCSVNNESLQGTWVSNEDEHYRVKFTKDKFYEIYGSDTSVYKYTRSSKSCDESYSKDPKLDFLSIDDGRCFEITGVTDTTLAYRYTVSGKMQVFHKLHSLKKNR